MFWSERAHELQAFCRSNPDYHIVSMLNGNVYLNRYAPGASMCFLASGNPDPRIIYDTTTSYQDSDVMELKARQSAP
jgi:hypothetical protein